MTFCEEHGIESTRSHPYQRNDQAWVEHKNSAIVRHLVGYERFAGLTWPLRWRQWEGQHRPAGAIKHRRHASKTPVGEG